MILSRVETPQRTAVFAKDHGAGTAQIYLRVGFKKSQLPGEPVRIGDIVGIHPGQVSSACAVDTFVEPRGEAPAPAVTPADQARVIEAVRNRQTVVAGTIVAKQKLKVAVALVQE